MAYIRYARRRAISSPLTGALLFAMPDFKVAILIDGGFLRVAEMKAKKHYDPDFIEAFAKGCKSADESIFRILYYDCALTPIPRGRLAICLRS